MIFLKTDFSSRNYSIYIFKIVYNINDEYLSYTVIANIIRRYFQTYDLHGYNEKYIVDNKIWIMKTLIKEIYYVTKKIVNIKYIFEY